ncbi:MAG: hypothetical protein H7210_02115 [Pyrinomonadaceae bacterium]|nr:hypothetical protein [Phycisphaerales bacterium]
MTGIVCYLERSGTGGAISRIRLVGPELDRTWTAPSSDAGSGNGAGMNGAGSLVSPVHSLRAAAEWVAEELGRIRELAAICIDPAGGVCGWLSTPSASPEIVIAALQQAQNSNMIPGVAEAPAGSGFSLLGDGPLGPGSDRSIEALAPAEAGPASPLISRLNRKGPKPGASGKRRLAVLSIPDAAARVFIDELDRLKIEVHSVMSLWHAAAAAWDPGRPAKAPRANRDSQHSDQSDAGVVVASSSPPTAVLLIEPSGRIVWTWSIGGDLVAAGSMRARVHARGLPLATTGTDGAPLPAGPLPGDPQSIPTLGNEDSLGSSPARRIGESAIVEPAPLPVVQYGDPEIGRLIMDWLSWSAQLGISPERIICLGSETTAGRDASLAATLSESLGRAWPGATADVAVYDDPIGATLNRLRGLANLGAPQIGAGNLAPSAIATADPRAGLVSLSQRPGRATRSIYRWGTLATLVAAVSIFFIARRLESASHDAAAQLEEIKAARTDLLKTIEPLLPGISTAPGAYDLIQNKFVLAREERGKLKREHPMLPELVRLLRNMEGFDKLEIQQIELSSLRGYMTVTLPYTPEYRDIPAQFYEKLLASPMLEMSWGSGDFDGPLIQSPPKDGEPQPDRRKHFFPGTWIEKTAPVPGPAPSTTIAPGGKS